MESHKAAVTRISSSVKDFYDQRKPFRIYHGSTNSTRRSSRNSSNTVDASALKHVLRVDKEKKVAWVEPNVAMDELVAETLKHGLVPKVVMEFPGITTGGGWNGTSGESSSFRHGYFDQTVNSVEMVLPDGEIITASPTSYTDLFQGSSSAVGTLSVTTLVELQLIDAKTYVELTYHPITSMDDGVRVIEQATDDSSVEYCDGILFSATSGAICTGRLTNTPTHPNTPIQRFSRAHDDWFYIHAQKAIKRNPSPSAPLVELVPIVDYFFRYNRGGFWVGTLAFSWFKLPFNRWNRWLLNYFMDTRRMYHALHKSGHDNFYIIQDVAVPMSRATQFVDEYVEREFKQYPIWLCPLLQAPRSSNFSPRALSPPADAETDVDTSEKGHDPSKMLLSFGVWGKGPLLQGGTNADFVEANRRLEAKVHSLGGKKWLYAHTYYTENEFWQSYDREGYQALRKKYHAEHLPDVYEKVRVKETWREEERLAREQWGAWFRQKFWNIWPLSGVYGVVSLVFGGRDYLRRKVKPQAVAASLAEQQEKKVV